MNHGTKPVVLRHTVTYLKQRVKRLLAFVAMPAHFAALASLVVQLIAATTCHAASIDVRVSDDLRTLSASVCVDSASRGLRGGDRAAADYLRPTRNQPTPGSSRWPMSIGAGDCASYEVDIGAAADNRALRRARWAGSDIIVSPELWLWLPREPATLHITLPEGMTVSAPWPKDAKGRYRLDGAPHTWAAQVAFGRFETRPLPAPGGVVNLAIVNEGLIRHPDTIEQWLSAISTALAQVHGRFPQTTTQVLVIPGDHTSTVPWGQVLRGGAPAVHLNVARDATLDELLADWTAFHEFSHLLMPYVSRQDAHLSEGFASYFQNVIRARSGNFTEKEAWTQLVHGFERGRQAAAARPEALRQASRQMSRSRNYMRVYWSGAAIALLGDVALRRDGEPGLDTLLGELNRCCADATRAWPGEKFVNQLDELAGRAVFAPLNSQALKSRAMPEPGDVLVALGVVVNGDSVELNNDAPLAHVRRAIMRGTDSTDHASD